VVPLPCIHHGRVILTPESDMGTAEQRALGDIGFVARPSFDKCNMGEGDGLQDCLPCSSARVQAIFWRGGKCCGLFRHESIQKEASG
jgi:hypothetical protein